MNRDKKTEEKRHLRLIEKHELNQSNEGPFEIGEPDFEDTGHALKGKITKYREASWGHPGLSGNTDEVTWVNNKEYQAQIDFTGYGPKGYQKSDDRIYEEVCEALMQSREVDATHIGVKVQNGIVFLSGRVGSRRMKKTAELIAEDRPGVKDVRNELAVIRGADEPRGPDSATGKDLGIY
jgi:hypothetical protein